MTVTLSSLAKTEVLYRFPVACIMLVAIFVLSYDPFDQKEQLVPIISSMLVVSFWSVSMTLYRESHQLSSRISLFIGVLITILIITGIWVSDNVIASLMPVFVSFISIFLAPYIRKTNEQDAFWTYSFSLLGILLQLAVASLILSIGIGGLLFAIDTLLGIDITKEVANAVSRVITLLVLPYVFLLKLPQHFDHIKEANYKANCFVLNYFLVPILLLYALVFHLYSLKILWQWELPQGTIVYMVSIYGVVCVLANAFIYKAHDNSKLVNWFQHRFHVLLIIPLILFWMAIIIRIGMYGFTVQRYASLFIVLWLSSLAILHWRAQYKNMMMPALTSLCLFMLIFSIGPINAWRISIDSQTNRLERMLVKYDRLHNGVITRLNEEDGPVMISKNEHDSIYSILRYLRKKDKSLNPIKPWFVDMPDAEINESRPNIVNVMRDMGFKHAKDIAVNDMRDITEHKFSISPENSIMPLSITDYDWLIYTNYNNRGYNKQKQDKVWPLSKKESEYTLHTTMDFDKATLCLSFDKSEKPACFDINSLINGETIVSSRVRLPRSSLSLRAENQSLNARLVIESLSGKHIKPNDINHINYISVKLLIQMR